MTTVDILNQPESTEWYTPAPYAEAARNVLAGIDLDPASCEQANRTIKAATIYTLTEPPGHHYYCDPDSAEDPHDAAFAHVCNKGTIRVCDGLSTAWLAHSVFLNPPYGRLTAAQVPDWMRALPAVQKMLKTFGKVSSAFIWSHYLFNEYRAGRVGSAILLVNNLPCESWWHPLKQFPICETDHRIKFNSTRASKKQPTKGQVFIFMPDIEHFRLPFDHDRCGEWDFCTHDDWQQHPSIADFIGEFSRFGFIYLPNQIALQLRELHRQRNTNAPVGKVAA